MKKKYFSSRGQKVATLAARAPPVRLVVVGSIAFDTIETPQTRVTEVLGGSVSYACAAASLFTSTGMIGVVGTDFPDEYVETYRRMKIDLTGLQFAQGKTFRWSAAYEADMNTRRTLCTELNVFESFMPTLPPSYRRAPFFLLANISPRLQLHVLEQATSPRFVMADTMDLWIQTERESLRRVIATVDMLTLNSEEARLLTNRSSLRLAADQILEWGPRYVVIKKGEHGAVLASRSEMFVVPAFPVDEVCDPTGAGDTFAGAFMAAIARHGRVTDRIVREALLYGSAVASFAVEAFGLKRLMEIGMPDVRARFVELRNMLQLKK